MVPSQGPRLARAAIRAEESEDNRREEELLSKAANRSSSNRARKMIPPSLGAKTNDGEIQAKHKADARAAIRAEESENNRREEELLSKAANRA